ncbi:hypothetical protein [Streptomyces sp. NPDC097619]|uniref:hypothetical protein n=1 Tax=Streptomyces sp. NPDC097619 TaxID=3157228 RepID=UPI003326EE87
MRSLADLTLTDWLSLDAPAARRVAEEAALLVGGRVSGFSTVDHLGSPLHRAHIERAGKGGPEGPDGRDGLGGRDVREFALIPGGRVDLGFDPASWRPAPGQEADYAASVAQGFGYGDDLRAHLAAVLSPRRSVRVPTLLMALEAEELTAPPEEMPAVLAALGGLRLPSPDEWEHACGAGADTLFRWGDDCPLDRIPYGDRSGPQNAPNAFGLRIAYDTYRAELTSDPGAVHGGDGGESVCGGYGALLGWLPLATAHRNPGMAEFLHGPDGDGLYEDFSTRPVLPL